MATLQEIRSLYDQGEFAKAMAAVWEEVSEERPSTDPEIGELCAVRAWCHYRQGEYKDAREWAKRAGQVRSARECLAYLAVYVDKDDEAFLVLVKELGDSANVQNALLIRVREATRFPLTHAEVAECLRRFTAEGGIEGANLFHNGARFFFAKARDDSDVNIAATLMMLAIEKYGVVGNWHHRAAVHFWLSQMYHRLGEKKNEFVAAQRSRDLWQEAVKRDPSNQRFRQQLENAERLVRELAG